MAKPIYAFPLQDEWDFKDIGDELASMPRSNLSIASPLKVWRTPDLDNIKLRVDLGASIGVNLVGLFEHNGTPGLPSSGPTWRIRADDSEANLDAAPGSEAVDSGSIALLQGEVNLSGWTRTNSYWFLGGSGSTARYWQVEVTDASNPDGYFEAGRLYFADAYQPTSGVLSFRGKPRPSYGEEKSWLETEAGSIVPSIRPRKRSARPRLLIDGSNAEAEYMDNLWEHSRVRGTSQDVFYAFDPGSVYSNHHCIYGVYSETHQHTDEYNRITVESQIEEYS
jgi:hypothetical protein